jgi:hypothetical protein
MCDYSNQASIRREALADMIRIAEEAGLYEDEPTLDEAVAAVKRVRELHKPVTPTNDEAYCAVCCDGGDYCDLTIYPCETIKALDGEQSD